MKLIERQSVAESIRLHYLRRFYASIDNFCLFYFVVLYFVTVCFFFLFFFFFFFCFQPSNERGNDGGGERATAGNTAIGLSTIFRTVGPGA